jgi:hypothetical protein
MPEAAEHSASDFRRRFHEEMVAAAVEHLESLDVELELAEPHIESAIREGVDRAGAALASTLSEAAPTMLSEHRDMWVAIREEISEVWGDILARLYAVLVCAEEIGAEFVKDHAEEAESDNDLVFSVLTRLLAQGVSTGFASWHLLCNGHPAVAWSTARSLHELNVTAVVIAKFGSDLAERFIAYKYVDQLRYIRHTDEHAERSGHEPFDADTRADVEARVDAFVLRYGKQFTSPYGWAAQLFGGERGFAALEGLAEMEHWRADYLAGSQFIHATPWGAELSHEAGAAVTYWRITGFGDPISHILISLLQLVHTVVARGTEANFYDLVALSALRHLVSAAEELIIPSERAASQRVEGTSDTAT